MNEDIRDDLTDSLELLLADRFKQGRGYSSKTIADIKECLQKELNELSESGDIEEMKRIAHELVQIYIPNRNKNDKKLNNNSM